jgi:hypothetical protein
MRPCIHLSELTHLPGLRSASTALDSVNEAETPPTLRRVAILSPSVSPRRALQLSPDTKSTPNKDNTPQTKTSTTGQTISKDARRSDLWSPKSNGKMVDLDDDDLNRSGPAPLGLTLNNSILGRMLRRKTLRAAVNDVGWSRSVGGGSIAQKLRLRERVLTFRCLHIVFTLAVWQHFFYNKYSEKLVAVPTVATNYHWKVLVPAIEFGLMHSILFQLALIPVTVSRSLLGWVATKTSALPLEHIMTLHIHIG